MLIFSLFIFVPLALAVQNYEAERDPPAPEAKKQFRLFLRTPDRKCDTWHKVTPVLAREDILVNSSQREDGGKGCRFLWVISPAEIPGAVRFELEGLTGAKEFFEQPAPLVYHAVKPDSSAPVSGPGVPGVAKVNGAGQIDTSVKGRPVLPSSEDPGTGI